MRNLEQLDPTVIDSIDHQHKGKEQPFFFGGKGKEQLVSSRLALRIRL
jgi:hypothetical protein